MYYVSFIFNHIHRACADQQSQLYYDSRRVKPSTNWWPLLYLVAPIARVLNLCFLARILASVARAANRDVFVSRICSGKKETLVT